MADTKQMIQEDKLLNLLPGHVTLQQSEGEDQDAASPPADVEGNGVIKSGCSNGSAGSHEQLTARFQEEREVIIEQLRKSLDMLFLRQAERLMNLRSETNHEPSSTATASTTSAPFHPAPIPEDEIDDGAVSAELTRAMRARDTEMSRPRDTEVSGRPTAATISKVISFANGHRTRSDSSICTFTTAYDCVTPSQRPMSTMKGGAEHKEGHSFKLVKHYTGQPMSTRFSDLEKARKQMSVACHNLDYEFVGLQSLEIKQGLSHFIKSSKFESCAAFLLCSNIALLGFQVEIQANTLSENDLPVFKTINAIYCVAFVTELALRVYAHRTSYLWGPDFLWNWFDFVVVMMQVGEIVIGFTTTLDTGSTFSFFGRLVRIARVARVVRAIRIMRFLRGFKVLIDAIYGTLCSCVWALMLLMIIIYVFSLIFAQFASDFLAGQEDPRLDYHWLAFYFGNFTSSMFTLLKAIVGGIDWEVCVVELSKIGSILVILFSVYVTLMQFVVINVIAGLFLQSAIEQAQQDQDHVISLRLQEKQHYVEKLKALFNELDSSHDGLVSLPEFEAHLQQEKVQAFFAGLEIENADAWTIFKLLDTDGGGAVDYTEFVEGCIRLKGHAKSIEMAQLMYHHKWIMDKVCELSEFLYRVLDPQSVRSSEDQQGCNSAPMLD